MPENCDFFRKSIFVGPLLVFLVQLVQRLKKQKTFFFKFCLLFVSSVDSKCCVEGRKEGKTTWRIVRRAGVKRQNVLLQHRFMNKRTDFHVVFQKKHIKDDTTRYALRHPWNGRHTGRVTSPKNRFSPTDLVGNAIDSGIGLSITIDNLRVFINKTLSILSAYQ